MNTSNDPSAAGGAALAAFGAVYVVVILVAIAITIVVQWKIASKAGYNGALSLLMLIPFVNFIILLIFAFGEWPIEKKMKAMAGGAGGTALVP